MGGLNRLAVVVLMATVTLCMILTAVAAPADLARRPAPVERAGIEQVLFAYFRKSRTPNPKITAIVLSTRAARFPSSAKYYYKKFAKIELLDKRAGFAAVLAGYYVAPLSGWRVLDLGSSEVGCSIPAAVFHGYKAAVLRDLALDCP